MTKETKLRLSYATLASLMRYGLEDVSVLYRIGELDARTIVSHAIEGKPDKPGANRLAADLAKNMDEAIELVDSILREYCG